MGRMKVNVINRIAKSTNLSSKVYHVLYSLIQVMDCKSGRTSYHCTKSWYILISHFSNRSSLISTDTASQEGIDGYDELPPEVRGHHHGYDIWCWLPQLYSCALLC